MVAYAITATAVAGSAHAAGTTRAARTAHSAATARAAAIGDITLAGALASLVLTGVVLATLQ